jgi:hypothetical protein
MTEGNMKSMEEANEFFKSKGAREHLRSTYREAVPKTKYKYEIIVQGRGSGFRADGGDRHP